MNRSEIKQALAGCEFFESLEEGDIEKLFPFAGTGNLKRESMSFSRVISENICM